MENMSDISKETLTFLAFFDSKMIERIPDYVVAKLCNEAADSNMNFYVDVSKSFEEQEISEKSKDLIAHIYYDYIAEEDEKQEILKQWNLNEREYQKALKEKYAYDNIFIKKKEDTNCVDLIVVEKKTIFQKIKEFLSKYWSKTKGR